jgi:hypothetical protein
MKGAMGVGWSPTADVDASQDPGATPARARCMSVMKAHGIAIANRTQEFQASYICDLVFFLELTGSHLTEYSKPGFDRAFDALGTVDSAVLTRASLTAARHDAASHGQTFVFDDACACLKYVDQVFEL